MGGAYLSPDKSIDTQLAIYERLPNIVPIDTSVVFTAVQNLLKRAATLVNVTALFLIFAGLPMILSTLIEARRRRLKTAVTLRLLGATRGTIISINVTEFVSMAMMAVLPAALLGTACSYAVVTYIFELEWQPQLFSILTVALGSTAIFLLLGIADIARIARLAPFVLLRNE